MDKRKFKDGEKVKYQGCVYIVQEAHYMYYPNGKWWEYYLFGSGKTVRVAEKDIDGIVIPPTQEKAISEAKKGKKRKNKNHGNETKEA